MATMYVTEQGALVTKKGQRLLVSKGGELLQEMPTVHIDRVVLLGNVHFTTPALVHMLKRGVDVVLLSSHGTLRGRIQPPWAKDAQLRQRQYELCKDQGVRLALAKKFVLGKLLNMAALWNRHRDRHPAAEFREGLKRLIRRASSATDLAKLRGYEGMATAQHFQVFKASLDQDLGFNGRAHRPPPDPVNALLSLGYTLLHNELYSLVTAVGLDPYLGFYHEIKRGHPALASDLLEEWRPVIVDLLVLGLINRKELTPGHFRRTRTGVRLTKQGLARFLEGYERRLTSRVTHPRLGRRLPYRRCLDAQVRLLAAYIRGDAPMYEPFRWR